MQTNSTRPRGDIEGCVFGDPYLVTVGCGTPTPIRDAPINYESGLFDENAFRRTLLSMSFNPSAPIREIDKNSIEGRVLTESGIPPIDRLTTMTVINHQ